MLTIDLTPTWQGLMPALLVMLTDGSPEVRKFATSELMRLARAVDAMDKANLPLKADTPEKGE